MPTLYRISGLPPKLVTTVALLAKWITTAINANNNTNFTILPHTVPKLFNTNLSIQNKNKINEIIFVKFESIFSTQLYTSCRSVYTNCAICVNIVRIDQLVAGWALYFGLYGSLHHAWFTTVHTTPIVRESSIRHYAVLDIKYEHRFHQRSLVPWQSM